MKTCIKRPAQNGLRAFPPWWLKFKVDLPECSRGAWRIIQSIMPRYMPKEAVSMTGQYGRPMIAIWPGIYRGLQRLEKLDKPRLSVTAEENVETHEWRNWMSDLPGEIYEHLEAIKQLQGPVLIGGLGLGVIVKAAIANPRVTRITVIEKDPDVIAMVGPHYQRDKRVQIVQCDMLEYQPPKQDRWEVVWMDIWPTVTAANLVSMIELRKAYRHRCRWYGAWCERWCLGHLRNEGAGMVGRELHRWIEKELRDEVQEHLGMEQR